MVRTLLVSIHVQHLLQIGPLLLLALPIGIAAQAAEEFPTSLQATVGDVTDNRTTASFNAECKVDELNEAFEVAEDLRVGDDNVTLNARPNVPPDLTPFQQHQLVTPGTYTPHDVFLHGSLQPQAYQHFGFVSPYGSDPYFLGGVSPSQAYGVTTVGSV